MFSLRRCCRERRAVVRGGGGSGEGEGAVVRGGEGQGRAEGSSLPRGAGRAQGTEPVTFMILMNFRSSLSRSWAFSCSMIMDRTLQERAREATAELTILHRLGGPLPVGNKFLPI